jgi:hypothetical protein
MRFESTRRTEPAWAAALRASSLRASSSGPRRRARRRGRVPGTRPPGGPLRSAHVQKREPGKAREGTSGRRARVRRPRGGVADLLDVHRGHHVGDVQARARISSLLRLLAM